VTDQIETPPAPPKNATEARAVLDARMADKGWGERVFNGDPNANKELRELTAMVSNEDASTVAAAMSGSIGDMPDSSVRLMANTADMLREIGFPEKAIHETLAGKVPTPDDIQRAQSWKRQAMNSPEWVRRYLSGEPDARCEMMAADVVITNGAHAKALKEVAP
jgi:hypothetical protein